MIIQTLFQRIYIPEDREYSIFVRNEYFRDQDGSKTEDIQQSCGVPYGDLCITGEQLEYVFGDVYAAYEVAARMIRYLSEHSNERSVCIDLEKLCEDGMGFKMSGRFEVNRI